MECDNFLFVHSTMHNNFTHIRGVKLLFASVMPTLTVIMSSGRKFIFLLDLMVILM